jgi:hypothetical protein
MKKYPDLEEFQVEDDLLEEAIRFQVDKQVCIDGRKLLVKLWAPDSQGRTEAEIAEELRVFAASTFESEPSDTRLRKSRGPAKVVYFERGAPAQKQNWSSGYSNSRPYFIGIALNREMTAPSFLKWVDREFLPFVRASMKLAARIDLPGSIEFTDKDEAVFRRVGGAAATDHQVKFWYRTKADARRDNQSNRRRQNPSVKNMRAKLFSVACYRFKMAGFSFREYNEVQQRIGLETYVKRNSEPVPVEITEEAFNGRLKIAAGLLRDVWAAFDVKNPENIPEAGFELGNRFRGEPGVR